MKIWLLRSGTCSEDDTVQGYYSTEEKANSAMERYQKSQNVQYSSTDHMAYVESEELDVDQFN